ncbi:protein phosphatase 2C domain-containing protein [Chryseobacterium indologenes]|uniref:PP2C family serine/threonine-protein phosphatase n=2 Tax=Chryseobacterium indologenes TaxID=253 RepID=UPI000F4F874F|nr:PP2C family serine/threonine-protein phosphatase [Chryseobacterium indologenes]AYZ34570.1 protein phosphatase 2C domain-containing protein [Chryseobacterium indologenes]MBU3048318.1 protein phosphatase 2C domain-containing protein [Chryseobacterium indologenes]
MGKFQQLISKIQSKPMEKSVIDRKKEEFKEVYWVLKNANSDQFYEFIFDMEDFPDIRIKNIDNLKETGLLFENDRLSGVPAAANVHHLDIQFFHTADPHTVEIKKVQLLINANPKDLWKNIPSDIHDEFYKPDEDSYKGKFSDKRIVVVSKRGRSHAHEGNFREDDFAVRNLPADWNIISVADGAGSAKLARKGSEIATKSINRFFDSTTILHKIEENIRLHYSTDYSPQVQYEAHQNIVRILYEGVLNTHNTLETWSSEHDFSLSDLNTTLIFALVKKFSFGYVIMSFGVGDCPVNLIDSDFSDVKLLNPMDVGEFSGGTRFITMKEIFNDQIVSRFEMTRVDDFAYLVLMTDGIYDPKFATENKLEDPESWKAFFNDLNGNNDDRRKVDFTNDKEIAQELLHWGDFWSRGNHDDRTLAIIY